MTDFTPTQVKILKMVQGNLPDSAAPYADIAREVGVGEEEVIGLLRSMKDKGQIRRFGATLRHQKAGYGANSMVAWKIDSEEEIMRVGKLMAENRAVSHCYFRKAQANWPYSLYTMVHGKSREDCVETARSLSQLSGVADYAMLFSIKELKKTSMTYF